MSSSNPVSVSPEFDFNLPCRYFKSSFARSLSLHNTNNFNNNANSGQCKSLDFDVNNHNYQQELQQQQQQMRKTYKCSERNSLILPVDLLCNQSAATTTTTSVKQTTNVNSHDFVPHNNKTNNEENEVNYDVAAAEEFPPPLPVRRPTKTAIITNSSPNSRQPQQQAFRNSWATANAANANASMNGGVNVSTAITTPATASVAATHGNINKTNKQPQQSSSQHANNNSNYKRQNTNGALVCNQKNSFEQNQCNLCTDSTNSAKSLSSSVIQSPPAKESTSDYGPALTVNATPPATTLATSEHHLEHLHNHNHYHQQQHLQPQAQQQQQQQQQQQKQQHRTAFVEVHDNSMNVEAVILQNQVDTLQWQLKQVETSCEMYRAVMEEVARFLERYQSHKQQQKHQEQQELQQQLQQRQQQEQQQQNRYSLDLISRSKSLHQVYGCEGIIGNGCASGSVSDVGGHVKQNIGKNNNKNNNNNSFTNSDCESKMSVQMRPRSSTSLSSGGQAAAVAAAIGDGDSSSNNIYDAISSSSNYNAFKDFTWRRSPKKRNGNCHSHLHSADAEEKLNQEAFRLARTIHNLLNTSTQQPDLMHHRNSFVSLNGKSPSASVLTLHATPMLHNSTMNSSITTVAASNCITEHAASATQQPELNFLRSHAMRDSRLSLRSSTDSSVHSTTSSGASTSSKVETDEDIALLPPPLLPKQHNSQLSSHPLGSTTEDESGFSSISSFQDIGVPLSSTMISNAPRSMCRQLADLKLEQQQQQQQEPCNMSISSSTGSGSDSSTFSATNECHLDGRNSSTLKATAHPNNIVGLPVSGGTTDGISTRWDTTTAKTYRNATKYQRFSTLSNDDASAVLWV